MATSTDAGGPLSIWLAQAEKEQRFRDFLKCAYGANASNAERAKEHVLRRMGVARRRDIDHHADVAQRFRVEIQQAYSRWALRR